MLPPDDSDCIAILDQDRRRIDYLTELVDRIEAQAMEARMECASALGHMMTGGYDHAHEALHRAMDRLRAICREDVP
jgi:hypothetical protein